MLEPVAGLGALTPPAGRWILRYNLHGVTAKSLNLSETLLKTEFAVILISTVVNLYSVSSSDTNEGHFRSENDHYQTS